MKIKSINPIYIEWCDAVSNTEGGWRDVEDAIEWGKEANWVVKQVGWILEENKKYILLISKIADKDQQVGHLMKIPKTWILKRKVLKP